MYTLQNFYKSTLLTDWTIGTGNFYVGTKPTVSSGYLVISPNNSSIREIIKYTATGTDGTGDYITVSARGVGGTTEQIHTQGEPIRMNITAEYYSDIFISPTFTGTVTVPVLPVNPTDAASKKYIDDTAIASSSLTVGQLAALDGTSGTPNSGNKYVTDADTTGTGAVQRASALNLLSQTTLIAGATITAGQALHLSSFGQSDGGILLDSKNINNFSYVSSATLSLTVSSGSNRFLVVSVTGQNGSNTVTGITYNGVAMTQLYMTTPGNNYALTTYYLKNPSSGTNNIVVTGNNIVAVSAHSYTGVDQTTPIEVSNNQGGNQSTTSFNLSSTTNGSIIYSATINGGLEGTLTNDNSYNSQYNTSISQSNINTWIGGQSSLTAGDTGKINEVQTVSVNGSITGSGGGTPYISTIGMNIKPATLPTSLIVVPTSTVASTFNEPLTNFIGFANSSVSSGASVVVNYTGIITGFSSLTVGKKYYLSSSSGSISSNPSGIYYKIIGVAISTTSILISKEKTMSPAISKVVTNSFVAECDGFLYAQASGAGTTSITITGNPSLQGTTAGTGSSGQRIPIGTTVYKGQGYSFTGTGGYFIPFI